MKIALLGFAKEGRSAFEYWNHDGNKITICDIDKNLDLQGFANQSLQIPCKS